MADYSGYTWTAFLAVIDGAIRNALGNRDPLTLRYELPNGGGRWEGRSLKELETLREFVAQRAADEAPAGQAATASRRRAYVRIHGSTW